MTVFPNQVTFWYTGAWDFNIWILVWHVSTHNRQEETFHEWFCLRFSSGVSVNISTEAAVIWKLNWGWRSSSPWWFTLLLVLREETQFPPMWASPILECPYDIADGLSQSMWSGVGHMELHADAHPFWWPGFYLLFIRTKSLQLAHIQREGLLALHFEGVSVSEFGVLFSPCRPFCSPGSCPWVALLQPRLTW